MDKRIISVALTGNWGDKSKNPALPMTPEEIAASAYDAYNAGASIAHIHMRDEEGKPTMRVDLFEKTIALIREKCDIIINMTSSGGHSLDGMAADETRMKPFEVLCPTSWRSWAAVRTVSSSMGMSPSTSNQPLLDFRPMFQEAGLAFFRCSCPPSGHSMA